MKCFLVVEMCHEVVDCIIRVLLFQPLELISIRKSDETPIRITVRLVGDLMQGDSHYLQFFNILLRKCLGHLDLQLVGRNFYDAKAKVIHLSAVIKILKLVTISNTRKIMT